MSYERNACNSSNHSNASGGLSEAIGESGNNEREKHLRARANLTFCKNQSLAENVYLNTNEYQPKTEVEEIVEPGMESTQLLPIGQMNLRHPLKP